MTSNASGSASSGRAGPSKLHTLLLLANLATLVLLVALQLERSRKQLPEYCIDSVRTSDTHLLFPHRRVLIAPKLGGHLGEPLWAEGHATFDGRVALPSANAPLPKVMVFVDGVLAATATPDTPRTVEGQVEANFRVVLPAERLTKGSQSRFDAYAVEAELAHPLEVRWHAPERPATCAIEPPLLGMAPTVRGQVGGQLDAIRRDEQLLVLEGWALARDGDAQVAQSVLLYVDGHLVAVTQPRYHRPDVGKRFGTDLDFSGFELRVPIANLPPAARQARLFAKYPTGFFELGYPTKDGQPLSLEGLSAAPPASATPAAPPASSVSP